eukprot:CFRG6201T1
MVLEYGPVASLALQQTLGYEKVAPVSPVSSAIRAPKIGHQEEYYLPQVIYDAHGDKMSHQDVVELWKCKKVYYYGQYAHVSQDGKGTADPKLFLKSKSNAFPFRMFGHITFRYEILSALGEGSFGHVVKVYDHKTKSFCAIKVVRKDSTIIAQAKVEQRILEHLNKVSKKAHNIVTLLDSFIFHGHLCFVFELQGDSLYDILKKRQFKGLASTSVRRIAHDVLKCLLLLSQEKIVHTDLKPENILLNNHIRWGSQQSMLDCSLTTLRKMCRFEVTTPLPPINSRDVYSATVIDFGCSDFVGRTDNTYVQSRYYRAPEVILGLEYGTSIDMWSLGCILAEMYTGQPLFPGEDETDQLFSIMEVLGHIPKEHIEISPYKQTYTDKNGVINAKVKAVTGASRRPRAIGVKSLQCLLLGADEPFVDFIERCLQYKETRWGPEHALRHPWLQEELEHTIQRTAGPERPVRPARRK